MKHLHTFESFLNESLNEGEGKVGRIAMKSQEELSKMSPEKLKELAQKVKAAMDQANSGWANVSPAQEKSKQQSIKNGEMYMQMIASALKGGDDKGGDDKGAKQEEDKLQSMMKKYQAMKDVEQQSREGQELMGEIEDQIEKVKDLGGNTKWPTD